jgi:opacity protein-like surface antigen
MRRTLLGLAALFSKAAFISSALAPPAAANGYRVQLAAYRTEARALSGWAQLRSAHSDLLGSFEPILDWAELGPGQGSYLRLQVGPFGTAAEADSLCSELRRRGASCLLVEGLAEPAPPPVANRQASNPQTQSGDLHVRVAELEDEVLELKVDSLQRTLTQLEQQLQDEKENGSEPATVPGQKTEITVEKGPVPPPPNMSQAPDQLDEGPVPSRGFVQAVVGATFDPHTDVIAGGAVGFRVTHNLDITGEAGYLRDVTTEPIFYSDELIQVGRRDPTFYAMGGIRYVMPLAGWAQPYVDAGLGVARVEPAFYAEFGGRDVTPDFRVIDWLPEAKNTSALLWSLGGGASIGRYRGLALDLGYRYLVIEGGTVLSVHRVHIGIGYAF